MCARSLAPASRPVLTLDALVCAKELQQLGALAPRLGDGAP